MNTGKILEILYGVTQLEKAMAEETGNWSEALGFARMNLVTTKALIKEALDQLQPVPDQNDEAPTVELILE